ncbi:HpcH/HpaI aldolase/citrate lyase family protein [Pendulispora albinea]|uniref:HpcH/HpaI aldolase/citrate lyase family protein n=1 Tax=Pendulispora albinea TaxID=2741071 RepID=A0ABZ2LR23_9BACT
MDTTNRFKIALRERRPQIGLWSSLCSHLVAEVIAGAGFDWIVIDSEHGPNELPDVVHQLQAMAPYSVEPVVRIPIADPVAIKRYLDAGARSILVPMVQNAAMAAAIVSATRYPPAGIRGLSLANRANRFGRTPDYVQRAADDICVLVQAETAEAISHIEAIATTPGIDGIFIGPYDLSADLGHIANPAAPAVQELIATGARRGIAAGKAMGILAPNENDANRYLDAGFTFVAVGSDVGILARQSEALAASFRHRKA